MVLVGVFGNLDAERARQITVGTVVSGIGRVLKVGTPMPARMRVHSAGLVVEIPVDRAVMVPAEVESNCYVRPIDGVAYCQVNGVTLQNTMLIVGQNQFGQVPFQIDQIRGSEHLDTVDVRVRLAGAADVISRIRVGDEDGGRNGNPLASGAVITAVSEARSIGPGMLDIEITLRLDAERTSNGRVYSGLSLRAGAVFAIRTARYEAQGQVLEVKPEWSPAPGGNER